MCLYVTIECSVGLVIADIFADATRADVIGPPHLDSLYTSMEKTRNKTSTSAFQLILARPETNLAPIHNLPPEKWAPQDPY